MGIKLVLYRIKERLKRRFVRWRSGYCLVLLYHRVAASAYDPQMLSVAPEIFRKQLLYLKTSYKVLQVNEFEKCIENGKFPGRCVFITFDDGYADNYHNALPILRELNAQALFYVATENIGTEKLFWWDELDLIFSNKARFEPANLSELLSRKNVGQMDALYEYYLRAMKRAASLEIRNKLLDEVRILYTVQPEEKEPYRALTLEELRSLSQSPNAVVGAHSRNHLSLAELPVSEQEYEMRNSVEFLEKNTGQPIRHFSYPYGEKHDYNQASEKTAAKIGFSTVAANFPGFVTSGIGQFSFPRFVVRNDEPETLVKKVKQTY